MEIITGTTDFKLNIPTAVAIGKFDGVHMGHRCLLEEILAKKEEGLKACVFTFDPAPAVLFGTSDGKELTTATEKREIFESLGIDILVEFPLNFETAGTKPEDFVQDILCDRLHAAFIAAGTDLSFGAKGAGNSKLLCDMSQALGFEVKLIDKIQIDGVEVSSTYIRALIEQGELERAKKFLGMPYGVHATVIHGNQIGRTIGFPTVNLLPEETKLLPPNGVYASEVLYDGCKYRAISNVGYKPTVTQERILGVESFLYDFDKEIYGENITVWLHAFQRPEMRFDSLEELQVQLQQDILAGADLSK